MVPGTKPLAVKAVISGKGTVHRLHLSESILIFKQHGNFFPDATSPSVIIREAKKHTPEKMIIIEVDTPDSIDSVLQLPVDGIQLDKFTPEESRKAVDIIKAVQPNSIVLIAGGINHTNIESYGGCGADVIVTSSMYHGAPFDIGVTIERLSPQS
jgi:molybdenum transport protein